MRVVGGSMMGQAHILEEESLRNSALEKSPTRLERF